MRANLHDELLADYAGLVAAFGRFDAGRTSGGEWDREAGVRSSERSLDSET